MEMNFRIAAAFMLFVMSANSALGMQLLQIRDVIDSIERFDSKVAVVRYRCESWEGGAAEVDGRWKLSAGGQTTNVPTFAERQVDSKKLWKNRNVYFVDGLTFLMPDTRSNSSKT